MSAPANHRGYFVAWRTDDFLELLRAKPNAFRLLALIAYRARYRDGYSADGLGIGEARLGRFDVERELGLTPKEYRTSCDVLEQGGFVALQRTHHGTVARIVDSRVFSHSSTKEGTPEGTGKGTARAHQGHTEGHKEESDKERREERERDGEASHPVQPPKGFPETETEAASLAAFVGCTEDFARQCWHESAARGGTDYGGNPILNWRSYLKARYERERGRLAEGKPTFNGRGGKPKGSAPDHSEDFFHGTSL